MSILSSKFDIVSVDNPVSMAALAQVLPVPAGMTMNSEGTPVAGTIPAGAIVTMNSSGEAVLATTADTSNDAVAKKLNYKMVFVAIDGNMDFSGAFVQKLTVLNGGFTMKTGEYTADPGLVPGALVTFSAGKIILAPTGASQIIGVVGPNGCDTVNGILEVIVPQGFGV